MSFFDFNLENNRKFFPNCENAEKIKLYHYFQKRKNIFSTFGTFVALNIKQKEKEDLLSETRA